MDIDADGNIDILSGSYSRMGGDMAGLFQVLRGVAGGGFGAATVLEGADGEPLIIPDGEDIDRICTRPTAVDLDGDGRLDIVSGNFRGTFYLFRGKADGAFEPTPTKLMAGEKELSVPAHSDPFFVDWDRDGDQDMLSGSAQGGAFLFVNTGTATEPKFAKARELVEPAGYPDYRDVRIGDAFLTGPQSGTRVWAADVNKDGKLDLLIGDNVHLLLPVEGVTPDEAREHYSAWTKRRDEFYKDLGDLSEEGAMEAYEKAYEALQAELAEKVIEQHTGFVWALYRK